jgi:hypothetical protein
MSNKVIIPRSIEEQIRLDLEKKMVFIAGPRQVGKTTISRHLDLAGKGPEGLYLNYDSVKDKKLILKETWDKEAPLLILDEIHKMRLWKNWIKGVYDTKTTDQKILVTGSARLDFFRKSGDSLAGRYFLHRLHPFSVKELVSTKLSPYFASSGSALEALMKFSGFPEPLLGGNEREADRWRQSHLERIIRGDMLDLQKVTQLNNIEFLIELLTQRVGSPVSYSSLAEDLSVAPKTVKNWIDILESLYVIFQVRPFSKNLNRIIKKEPKIYFYDYVRVPDQGARLENLVAAHLLKRAHFLQDSFGKKSGLFYLRDKEKREVDFLSTIDNKIEYLIEVKTSDDKLSPHLSYYQKRLSIEGNAIQLVFNLEKEQHISGCKIKSLDKFLAGLEA